MKITNRITGKILLEIADLRGADLRDADLTDADLTGADLRGADLRGADLTDAKGRFYFNFGVILEVVKEE